MLPHVEFDSGTNEAMISFIAPVVLEISSISFTLPYTGIRMYGIKIL